MKIARWHKCSLSAYPGKRALVVFTAGCNLRCYFCRNRNFLVERPLRETIPVADILSYLRWQRGSIDSVVVRGGEPSLQPGLEDFLFDVRRLGYATKIDTNGSNPGCLERILKNRLADYVALDLKAPPERLKHITGVALPSDLIEESKRLLMKSDVDYEFRTTVLPELTFRDVLAIGKTIAGARCYALQQYRKPPDFPSHRFPYHKYLPHSPAFFHELAEHMKGWFQNLVVRGVNLDAFYRVPRYGEKSCLSEKLEPPVAYLA